MHIGSAKFITSAAQPGQFLKQPFPHFVFAGRSNVGKSSVLNKLLNRKTLAKTSQHPGKTRLINYFLINNQFFFVDIPGYGFARVSKSERRGWRKLVESYLLNTPYIGTIFQLLDIRHDPTANDLQLTEWLQYYQMPYKVLLTKADKLSRSKAQQRKKLIAAQIKTDDLILTSAVTAQGMRETWQHINGVFEETKLRISRSKDSS